MTIASAIRQFSFEDYHAYDDGTETRYELVKGLLEPRNLPTFRHVFIRSSLSNGWIQKLLGSTYLGTA
jgi:hypothetical protein